MATGGRGWSLPSFGEVSCPREKRLLQPWLFGAVATAAQAEGGSANPGCGELVGLEMAAGRRGSSSKTGGEKGAASSGPLISADSSSAKSPAAAAASVSAAGGRATSSSSGGVSLGFSGSNFTHRLADLGRSVLSKLTPKPSQSNFVAAGTLTPEEFVDAGDLLVHRFPTWQW